jgi:flagellar protein FlgJ
MNCENCKTFVHKNWENAVKTYKKYGIHPIITLSQSAKETGWGQSNLAKNHNNYFGIRATGSINEHWKGQHVQTSSGKWKKYEIPLLSYLDFGRLIKKNYHTAYQHAENPSEYAKAISQSSYIVDSDDRNKYYTDLLSINNRIQNIVNSEKLNITSNKAGINVLGMLAILSIGIGLLIKS